MEFRVSMPQDIPPEASRGGLLSGDPLIALLARAQVTYSLSWTQAQPSEPLKVFIAVAERLAAHARRTPWLAEGQR
jgi:hypothetical protein